MKPLPSSVKVLDIGSGAESVAKQVFSHLEIEVTRLDADAEVNPDILHDITQPLPEELHGAFDIVYVSHVLEHIDRLKVIEAFRNATKAMKNLGEIWVLVPSMEWAANEIINRREGVHVQANLFGGQRSPFDYHRCGFTLSALRQLAELSGLIIRKAYQSPFTVSFDNKEYVSLQNVVIAIRFDQANDPSMAIEDVE